MQLRSQQWNDYKNRVVDRNICSNMELKQVLFEYRVAKEEVVLEHETANTKTKSPVLRALTENVVVTEIYRQFGDNKTETTPSSPQHRRRLVPRRNSPMDLICKGSDDSLPTKQPSQENLMELVRLSSEPLLDTALAMNENDLRTSRCVASLASDEGVMLLHQQEHYNRQQEFSVQLDEAASFTAGLCFEESTSTFEGSHDSDDDDDDEKNPDEMDQLRVYL